MRSLKAGKSEPMNLTGRTLRVANKTVQAAVTNTISVQLDAQGDENALGFSLSFDPVALQFVSVSAGSGVAAPGSLFNTNPDHVATGKLGIALALPQGLTFTPGTVEVAKISFAVAPSAAGTSNVVFVNSPILMEVSDVAANALATTYTPGTVTISPFPPVLRINAVGTNVTLAWPVVSSNYVLQASDAVSGSWSNAVEPVVVVGQDNVVTAPNIGTKFYRLFKP